MLLVRGMKPGCVQGAGDFGGERGEAGDIIQVPPDPGGQAQEQRRLVLAPLSGNLGFSGR